MHRPPLHARIVDSLREAGSRVIDAREWLAERWDRFFGRFFEKVLDVFDSFESLEAAIVRAVQVVLWPFLAVVRLLRIDRLLWALFQLPGRAAWGLHETMLATAERLHLGGAFQWVSDAVYWLMTPLRAIGGFLYAWCVTRRPRDLALATPALLMLLPFVYVAIAGAVQSQGAIADRYRQAVRDAELEEDHEQADLMRRKLEQLGVSTSRTDFIAALRLAEQGRVADAYEKMKQMAPADQPGYLPAHYWIVQKLLANEIDEAAEPTLADPGQRLDLALRRLDQIASTGGESEALALMRAYVLAEKDEFDLALEAISPYATSSFRPAALRLRLLAMSRQQAAAASQAAGVLRLFQDSPPPRPTADDHRSRVLAASLVGEDLATEQALIDLVALDEQDEQARRRLAMFSLRLAQQTLGSEFFGGQQVAERVVRAQRLGAPSNSVAQVVAAIVGRRRQSDACREAWNQLLAAADATDQLIQEAGTIAAAAGEITQARKAFRQLTDAGDAPAVVWNNLAWTLLQEPMPQYSEALKAVNAALAAEPHNPRFLETRGQAYVRLKRWQDAVTDLEHVLNSLPDSAEVHAGLATAYDALGDAQLADVHRQHSGE